MASRPQLHEKFKELTKNVYFRPPESERMKYPCILYDYSKVDTQHANNGLYHMMKGYKVTVIDENEDSEIPDKILAMPYCKFDRPYMADNLNHWVFTLYY